MNINLKVVVFLLSIASAAFAIVMGVAVGSGDLIWPALMAAGFAVILFVSQPSLAAAGAICTYASGVTVPGLPGQMKLSDVLTLLLIGIFVLQWAMKSRKAMPFSKLDWVVVAFAFWILFIGLMRGFGFLFLGNDMIGGFFYLRLLLTASLVITLPRIGIPTWSWKSVLLLSGLLAPATVIADLLVTRGGYSDVVRLFIQTSEFALSAGLADETSTSVGRLWSAGPAANGMLIALLCLVPMRRFFQPSGLHWLVLFGGIVTLSLMSGFRLMTAMLFVIAAFALYFQKGLTASRLLVLFIAVCGGLFAVYYLSTSLPPNIQRAISWLPGIDVSSLARDDAEQTVGWRLRLWHEAVHEIPNYWLIGKGFAYNARDMIAAVQMGYLDELKWAFVTGSYHNGWLSMILCTGVVGLCLCLAILIGPSIRHWRRQFAAWNNPRLKQYHGVFLAALVTNVLIFVTIYGDVQASFPWILFDWALLETLSRADVEESWQAALGDDPDLEDAESTYQS